MMSGILPPPGGGGQTPPTTQPQTTTSQSQPTGNGTQSAAIKTEADVELTQVPNNTTRPVNQFQPRSNAPNAPTRPPAPIQQQTRIGSGLGDATGSSSANVGDGRGTHPDELTPEEMTNVTKCRNFLITLIQLAQRNEQTNPQTVQNVKDLVQQLIDDRIPAQLFTERLQTELQSTPQPYLVPFLRRSLPLLRRSMQQPRTSNQQTSSNNKQPSNQRPVNTPSSSTSNTTVITTPTSAGPVKRPAPTTGTPIPLKQPVIKQEAQPVGNSVGPGGNQAFVTSTQTPQGTMIRRQQPITPRNPPGSAPTIQIVNKPIPPNARLPVKPGVPRQLPGRPQMPIRYKVQLIRIASLNIKYF